MHTRRWLTAALSLVLACSRGGQMAGPPGGPVAPGRRHSVSVEQATWRALAAFDSAARTGDTTRMAAVFADDALLITPQDDSIRGRDAIAHFLVALDPNAISAEFSFGREGSLERCLEGVRERVSYTARINHEGRTRDAVSGSFLVFWKPDSTGDLEVTWAALSEGGIARGLRPSRCRAREDSIWRAWHVAVTLVPVPEASTLGPQRSFEALLRARGWVDVSCKCITNSPTYTPVSKWTALLPPYLVSLQYRIRRHVVAELQAGRNAEGSTMGARFFSNRDYGQMRLSYSGTLLGAVLSYERWGMHLGVGPGLQVSQWSLRDSLVPFNTSGCCASGTGTKWTQRPLGIIVDARFQRMVLGRVFFALRGQVRRFQKAATPSTPRFPAAALDQGSGFIGVGLGVVF